jgi:hypothetical protein
VFSSWLSSLSGTTAVDSERVCSEEVVPLADTCDSTTEDGRGECGCEVGVRDGGERGWDLTRDGGGGGL